MMNPHAVDWRTADFKPGDIVVLGKICSTSADHSVFDQKFSASFCSWHSLGHADVFIEASLHYIQQAAN